MNKVRLRKQSLMKRLIGELEDEDSVESILVSRNGKQVDVGLVNHFKLHKKIPNKWFDWVRKVNAPIVIIGQDWGPYIVLLKFIEDYSIEKDSMFFSYDDFLFKTFSSRTEKFIIKAIQNTYEDTFKEEFPKRLWELFFFTMAVLFTRQGKHFRGNYNFDSEKSTELSFKYVSKQLDIVKPKIVIPLGNLALRSVDKHYQLGINNKKISKLVEELRPKGYIQKGQTYILPNFHPASHITPKIQLDIWKKIWQLIRIEEY